MLGRWMNVPLTRAMLDVTSYRNGSVRDRSLTMKVAAVI